MSKFSLKGFSRTFRNSYIFNVIFKKQQFFPPKILSRYRLLDLGFSSRFDSQFHIDLKISGKKFRFLVTKLDLPIVIADYEREVLKGFFRCRTFKTNNGIENWLFLLLDWRPKMWRKARINFGEKFTFYKGKNFIISFVRVNNNYYTVNIKSTTGKENKVYVESIYGDFIDRGLVPFFLVKELKGLEGRDVRWIWPKCDCKIFRSLGIRKVHKLVPFVDLDTLNDFYEKGKYFLFGIIGPAYKINPENAIEMIFNPLDSVLCGIDWFENGSFLETCVNKKLRGDFYYYSLVVDEMGNVVNFSVHRARQKFYTVYENVKTFKEGDEDIRVFDLSKDFLSRTLVVKEEYAVTLFRKSEIFNYYSEKEMPLFIKEVVSHRTAVFSQKGFDVAVHVESLFNSKHEIMDSEGNIYIPKGRILKEDIEKYIF